MTWPDPTRARLVAVTELRRRWRAARGNTVQLAAMGLVGVFYLVALAATAVGGFAAGRHLASGEVRAPLRAVRLGAAAVVVFPASIVFFRTIARLGSHEALDGLLTTIPHRDLAAGLLLAEAAWVMGLAAPVVFVGAGALAVGAGAPPLAASVLVAVVALLAVGLALGFALGFAARTVLARSALLARHKTALGAAAFAVYMGLVVTERLDAVLEPVLQAVRRSPVGWFGDLALLPLGGASPALAAAALVAVPIAVGGLVAASAWLAGRYWYGDHARGLAGATRTSGFGGGRIDRAVGWLPRPTARVATKSWRRAIRAPITLVYVVYPLFVLVGPVSQAVRAGVVPPSLPPLLALYGAWATGAAFTLNPLGDEGAVLPVTLTTPVDGRSFVGGLVVAGAGVGVPVTGVLAFGAALASSLAPATAVVTGLLGAALPLCGAALAAGVGAAFPQFEASNVTRSRQAVVPSMYAFGAFSLALLLAWVPAGLGGFAAEPIAAAIGVPPAAVAAGGALATLGIAAGTGVLSARHAVRRFDRFHL